MFAIYTSSFIYTFIQNSEHGGGQHGVHAVATQGPNVEACGVGNHVASHDQPRDRDSKLYDEQKAIDGGKQNIFQTILAGLPTPTSLKWSVVIFVINLTLVTMVADFIYRAPLFYPSTSLSMARVGYVSDSVAKILVREPDFARYPVSCSYRPIEVPPSKNWFSGRDDSWRSAGIIKLLDNSTDYTSAVEIRDLHPDTRYQYAVNQHTGYFTTAPKPGHTSTRAGTHGVFTFVHSSCVKNRFPYHPLVHPLSNKGLDHLSRALSRISAQFMLFLGDFIYVDVPRRLGSTTEDYRREYRQVYSSPDWPAAGSSLPWIHTYDDHEIANDWDRNTTAPFPAAHDPYTHYHLAVNPPPLRPNASYSTFTHGPATFFILDTRRHRSANVRPDSDPDSADPKTMLGATQLADVQAWLRRREPPGVRWKILCSSVPFTRNWRVNAADTWRGFARERRRLLEDMWDVPVRSPGVGVVVLSGDRHEFAATAFPPPPDHPAPAAIATVHEFSTSPLNMFSLGLRSYAADSDPAAPPQHEHTTTDIPIRYIPGGTSKFGVVDIESPSLGEQSLLRYRLFVDGVETWRHVLASPVEVGLADREAVWG